MYSDAGVTLLHAHTYTYIYDGVSSLSCASSKSINSRAFVGFKTTISDQVVDACDQWVFNFQFVLFFEQLRLKQWLEFATRGFISATRVMG